MRQHITIKDIARIAGVSDFYRLPAHSSIRLN